MQETPVQLLGREDPLEKGQATHSSGSGGKEPACDVGDLALIPGLGRLPGTREQPPTPVFLPGECHEQKSLAGYNPQGHKESDTTE